MAKYLFVYHGGKHPETEQEQREVMDAWGTWMASIGKNLTDGGNPVGMSTTVLPGGKVEKNGGSNPASGYSLIEASDDDAAVKIAKGCPILAAGGSIELAECFDM